MTKQRERVLEVVMKALDKYYGDIYNGYAKENDRNNGLRIVVEAAETANYVKDNLK